MLTDKARNDCYYWAKEKGFDLYNAKDYPLDVAKSIFNAVLIEWFDSVGLIILIPKWVDKFYFKIENNYESDICYETRFEATTEAILKANEIYNTK